MKKFNRGHIYYSLVSSVFYALVVLVFFGDILVDEETQLTVGNSGFYVLGAMYGIVYVARVMYSIAYVYFSGYELTDREIRCRTGVFFRKNSILSYQKIHAVNKRQGLLQRFFDIATLTVDSGATGNAFGAEITIIERSSEVDRLMEQIKRYQEGTYDEILPDMPLPPKENLYTFSSALKLVYSALHVAASVLAILVLALIAVVLLSVTSAVLRNVPEFSVEELWMAALFISVLSLILVSILSLIGGMITSFFGYYDFKVHKNREDVEISYGLFVRHTNHFKFRRIKAVKLMEGPVKRLFGFTSAGLEVVGYGTADSSDSSEQNQSAAPGMLLPLCKADKVNEVLQSILPGYVPDPITHRAKSWWAFVLWPAAKTVLSYFVVWLVVWAVLLVIGANAKLQLELLCVLALVAAVNLLGLAILATLKFFNAGIAVGDGKLTVQNGIFVRRRTVIRSKDLIGIECVATPMQSRRGICSYRVHFFTNAMTNTVEVLHLEAALKEQLEHF